jgi:hypothetical protein
VIQLSRSLVASHTLIFTTPPQGCV